jgi:hypothetical protein
MLWRKKNMSQSQNQQKQRKMIIGRKEKEIIEFLKQYPQGVWKEDILQHFAISSKYRNIIVRRLYKMQEKGLIEIRLEQNPISGRLKQKVYLKQ